MDGTIVDTEPAAAKAVLECFAGWGLQLEQEDARYVAGRTWSSAFEFLFRKYQLPISEEKASHLIMERYREALALDLKRVPGSVEAIRSLVGHFKLALVSGSRRNEILWILDKLEIRDCFQVILGAEDYPHSKPEPDGFLKALEMMKEDPASGLVFEDSEAGIASGRAAGLWVVAVTSTNHFDYDLSGAHEKIRDLTGVTPAWISSLKLQNRS